LSKEYPLDASLEELLALARTEFGPVCFEDVRLGSVELKLLQIEDMPRYLESLVSRTRPGESVDLPLWAKIWPPCLILGMFLQRHPFAPGAEILEVGAGGGLCGLVAAARGFSVTLTDMEPSALLFCRINALKNGLAERVRLQHADFTRDRLGRRFQAIVGCEVLYNDAVYAPFLEFLQAHLAEEPGAEVFLGLDEKRTGKGFFALAQEDFRLLRKDVPYQDRETGESTVTCLYRLERKPA